MSRLNILVVSLILLVFTACSIQSSLGYREINADIDLSKYGNNGFFITTGDCFTEYTPIAIVQQYCRSGMISDKDTQQNRLEDDIYRDRPNSNYRECELEYLIDIIVEDAIKKGANGIISLKIEKEVIIINGLEQGVIKISGLAIERH